MSTEAGRAAQRAGWKRALAAAAAARRSQRHKRAAPQPKAGMLRKTDAVTASTTLPKCTMAGCPVRYRGGPDRPCPMHQDDSGRAAAEALAGLAETIRVTHLSRQPGVGVITPTASPRDLAATAPGERDGDGRRPDGQQ